MGNKNKTSFLRALSSLFVPFRCASQREKKNLQQRGETLQLDNKKTKK